METDKAIKKAKEIFALREYGIITISEYVDELNNLRVSLGLERLPLYQNAQQSMHPTLGIRAAFQAFVYAVQSSVLTAFRRPPQRG